MDIPTQTVRVKNYLVDVISDDLYIKNTLLQGYEWDGWMRSDLPFLYKPGTDIIDIGGNIGYNTLMFSDYGPVHTFEPLFYSIINKNVEQNILKNPVKVYPVGLSDVTDTVPMYQCKPQDFGRTNYGACSMYAKENFLDKSIADVPVVRLDDVYNGKPSIIKIDVEGNEYKVLLGAERTIREHKPSLYVEIVDFDKSPVVPFLLDMGYRAYPRPELLHLFVQ
jgi:FkbM family methyltransferase